MLIGSNESHGLVDMSGLDAKIAQVQLFSRYEADVDRNFWERYNALIFGEVT